MSPHRCPPHQTRPRLAWSAETRIYSVVFPCMSWFTHVAHHAKLSLLRDSEQTIQQQRLLPVEVFFLTRKTTHYFHKEAYFQVLSGSYAFINDGWLIVILYLSLWLNFTQREEPNKVWCRYRSKSEVHFIFIDFLKAFFNFLKSNTHIYSYIVTLHSL